MTRAPPPEIEAYLDAQPPAQRAALQKLRGQILAAAPKATERMSYGMPAFEHEGILVWIAGFRDHCSLFAKTTGVALALESGLTSKDASKGTIRFAPEKPLPATLVRKIVKLRLAENAARAKPKKAKAPRRRKA